MSIAIFPEVQRTGHVAVVHEGSLFIWGGYKVKTESEVNFNEKYLPGAEVIEYDPIYEKWFHHKCRGVIPPGTSGAAAVKADSKLYCFGGYRENGNTNDLFSLDITTFTWRYMQPNGPPPIPCDKTVGWEHNNRLFFFGGFGLQPDARVKRPHDFSFVGDVRSAHEYKRGWNNQLVCFDVDKEIWSIPMYKGHAPVARAAHACAKVKSKVFIMGGRHLERRMNDLHCFDTDTMEWSGQLQTCGPEPVDRSWHSLTAVTDEVLLLYGGFSQHNVPLSDCWLLCLKTLTWMKLDFPLNRPRLWHTANMLTPGEIFICGGCSQNILSSLPTHDHSVELIVLRFSPKSLLRICLDNVAAFQPLLQNYWSMLPSRILQILSIRVDHDPSFENRPFSGSSLQFLWV